MCWDRVAGLRAGGEKAAVDSLLWGGGEEDGVGAQQHVGYEWHRQGQETVWRNMLVRS